MVSTRTKIIVVVIVIIAIFVIMWIAQHEGAPINNPGASAI